MILFVYFSDVCFKKFPHTNQDKIDFHLKSWIRHSKEKYERVVNNTNIDDAGNSTTNDYFS